MGHMPNATDVDGGLGLRVQTDAAARLSSFPGHMGKNVPELTTTAAAAAARSSVIIFSWTGDSIGKSKIQTGEEERSFKRRRSATCELYFILLSRLGNYTKQKRAPSTAPAPKVSNPA